VQQNQWLIPNLPQQLQEPLGTGLAQRSSPQESGKWQSLLRSIQASP
jgi:hypothetical protein